jgi:hypothetical protein
VEREAWSQGVSEMGASRGEGASVGKSYMEGGKQGGLGSMRGFFGGARKIECHFGTIRAGKRRKSMMNKALQGARGVEIYSTAILAGLGARHWHERSCTEISRMGGVWIYSQEVAGGAIRPHGPACGRAACAGGRRLTRGRGLARLPRGAALLGAGLCVEG